MKTKLIISLFLAFVLSNFQATAQLITNQQATDNEKVKFLWGGYIGVGYGVHTDEMSEYFKNTFQLPITLDMAYKSLILQLNLDAGFGKVAKTMTFDDGTSWNKNDKAFHNTIGGNIGFSTVNTDKVRIVPIVGYASNYISKTWWNSSDISKHEPQNSYLNLAFFVDYKLKNREAAIAGKYNGYSGIRFSTGIYLPMGDNEQYPEYYNGSTIYFTVGIPALYPWVKFKDRK